MKRLLTSFAVMPLALALALLGNPAHAAPQAPVTKTFDVSDLSTGAPPKLVWSETTDGTTSTVHGPAGDTTVQGDVAALAPMGSGFVVQTVKGGRTTTRWVGADGSPGRSSWRSGFGLATSPDGEAVAFTTRRGGVRAIDEDGDRVLRMPSVPSKELATPVYVSSGDCKEDETSNGCAILVNSTRRLESWVVSSHGIVDITGFKAVGTARGRWAGGIVQATDTGTCSVMRRNLKNRWRTCDNQLSDISPDQRRVLGTPAFADGFGPTTLDVLDLRTGRVMTTWRSSRKVTTTYFDQVWEDATHVLVVTYHDEAFAVVRLDVTDGSMEYAVEPVADTDGDMESPFHLQTR
ncbi:hypothetical protein [Nocardioides currus]|uniref:WD40 repeat domain-containing protein n=1 Tax=Nocardioides currus TaxID=2133958 RepID=A0A2R7YZH9_9ACTN|nr:hypothetical protein [Nocardioides currus]PUA81788.1 hypothetical protein C7S10_06890 [Nocardioides currus]